MEEVILWCNQNQGFVSAVLSIFSVILSVITIILTVIVANMPFKKTVKIIPFLYKENGDWEMSVTIINTGRVTMLIDSIVVKNNRGVILGQLSVCKLYDGEVLALEPTKAHTEVIALTDKNNTLDKHGIDLNRHIKIIVCEVGHKQYTASTGFPVG